MIYGKSFRVWIFLCVKMSCYTVLYIAECIMCTMCLLCFFSSFYHSWRHQVKPTTWVYVIYWKCVQYARCYHDTDCTLSQQIMYTQAVSFARWLRICWFVLKRKCNKSVVNTYWETYISFYIWVSPPVQQLTGHQSVAFVTRPHQGCPSTL